jgi:predicted heme/steroid binding protein
MKKIIVFISISLILFGCSTSTPAVNQPTTPNSDPTIDEATGLTIDTETGLLQMTVEELAQFNGKDGAKAYVAVDGNVYDVTGNRKWLDGNHEKGMSAGRDLSEFISGAPHGKDILKQFTIVGKIVE